MTSRERRSYNPFPHTGSVATDTDRQATFLPAVRKAESEMRMACLLFAIGAITRGRMSDLIDRAIRKALRALKKEKDGKTYLLALESLSRRLIRGAEAVSRSRGLANEDLGKRKGAELTLRRDMRAEAKASVRVEDYPKRLKAYIARISSDQSLTPNGISAWQKAEIDIRHERQMENLSKLRGEGVEYAYISSHPDCSERCRRWQGKLVALNLRAKNPGFVVGRKDGRTVYSLPDIMAQKDRYGYENNVICGFNCRHYLIPYEKGDLPPTGYEDKELRRKYADNNEIKAMERAIRKAKERERLLRAAKADTSELRGRIRAMTAEYKGFCEAHGFKWEPYRIE